MIVADFVAHYLRIEWRDRGLARQIAVSDDSIELEQAEDGSYQAETTIFRDYHPWVGLCFGTAEPETPPHSVDAQGKTRPWLRIVGSDGRGWWVQDDGWDPERHVHLSELHRSFGRFEIRIGRMQLFLTNIALDLGRAEVEDYLEDFGDELIMLALSHKGTATGEYIRADSRDLIDALSEFTHAARRVLVSPARELTEVEQLQRVNRLRPNAKTFRDILRHPGQRSYLGRGASDVADIPDNRFMRYMVQYCARMSARVAGAAEAQSRALQKRAERATQHGLALAEADHERVAPEIFDTQLAEMQAAIDAVNTWSMQENQSEQKVRSFKIATENPYTNRPHTLFYKNREADPIRDKNLGITSSIVQLPAEVHQLVARACKVMGNYPKIFTFTGLAEVKKNPSNGSMRLLHIKEVHRMEVRSAGLENKAALRVRYEKNGWLRKLTRQELEERRLEARSSERRAAQFADRGKLSHAAAEILRTAGEDLKCQDQTWASLGVAAGEQLPMGMRFVQSPAYSSALGQFNRLQELAAKVGIGGDRLEQVGRISILHASAIYERWCLIQIISLLIDSFRFVPQPDWLDRVVTGTCGPLACFELKFNHADFGMTALLEFQPQLPNGRRPDFRINFQMVRDEKDVEDPIRFDGSEDNPPTAGLILDAKFRTRWRKGEVGNVLHDLTDLRGYRETARGVFILQPAAHIVAEPSSPLYWGRDCDYGQNYPDDHRQGFIRIDPSTAGKQNLHRLIAQELQSTFPTPRETNGEGWVSDSFCIGCGCRHEAAGITHRMTKKGKNFWYLSCVNCGLTTWRTHCFSGCGTTLFKNGLLMTYHRTIADQLTNVVCPSCGEFFDSDMRSFDSRDDYFSNDRR